MSRKPKKPYVPPTNWDPGSTTLAAVYDPAQAVREFRAWLREHPPTQRKGDPNYHKAMKRAAKAFCEHHHIGPHLEKADWIDPETGKNINPNGVKRARRINVLESYYRRGKISQRQFSAGEKLAKAFEATMKSAPAIKKVQVDSSPKPDAQTAMQISRISDFNNVAKFVPAKSRAIIDLVVYQNHSVGHDPRWRAMNLTKGMTLLRDGLDAVADGLGVS